MLDKKLPPFLAKIVLSGIRHIAEIRFDISIYFHALSSGVFAFVCRQQGVLHTKVESAKTMWMEWIWPTGFWPITLELSPSLWQMVDGQTTLDEGKRLRRTALEQYLFFFSYEKIISLCLIPLSAN